MNRTDPLDVDIIKADLQRRLIGTEAVVYESTSSTNDIAWEYADNPDNSALTNDEMVASRDLVNKLAGKVLANPMEQHNDERSQKRRY